MNVDELAAIQYSDLLTLHIRHKSSPVIMFSKFNQAFLRCFDLVNVNFDDINNLCLGGPNRYIGENNNAGYISSPVMSFTKSNNIFLGYFDTLKTIFDSKTK